MHRYQTLLQPSLRTVTRVQKVDISALATRRNRSFYHFEGMGINSRYGRHPGGGVDDDDGRRDAPVARSGIPEVAGRSEPDAQSGPASADTGDVEVEQSEDVSRTEGGGNAGDDGVRQPAADV